MALSDTLSDSHSELEKYLAGELANMYDAETLEDLSWLLKRMEELRVFLDTPPNFSPQPPKFASCFGLGDKKQ